MPRNVRNFWIEVWVDGRKTKIAVGPRAKDGGFEMTISIREDGAISSKKLYIDGYTYADGTLEVVQSSKGTIPQTLLSGKR